MQSKKIINLTNPAADQDAATKKYVDDCGLDKWLVNNGTLACGDFAYSNGTAAVYTVPANKVYYLLSVCFQWKMTDADSQGECYMLIGGLQAIRMQTTNTDEDHAEVVENFSVPIKLTAGQTIQIDSANAGLYVVGSCVGYLVDA